MDDFQIVGYFQIILQNQNISPTKKENKKYYCHNNNIHKKNLLNHHLYSSHNGLPNNDADPFRQNEPKRNDDIKFCNDIDNFSFDFFIQSEYYLKIDLSFRYHFSFLNHFILL